ncbi:hypothetical protein DPEC_G00121890 [Dallia pectoralis]|uniref:Uncharacterized protein n=1 Tax=Dallia pectoralis TaxID=75939 RepID=A0ACC2GQ44_DALPE|nr:hypothetical protein DPEC_G00121890 [Dallia pectoralis]
MVQVFVFTWRRLGEDKGPMSYRQPLSNDACTASSSSDLHNSLDCHGNTIQHRDCLAEAFKQFHRRCSVLHNAPPIVFEDPQYITETAVNEKLKHMFIHSFRPLPYVVERKWKRVNDCNCVVWD